MERNQASIFENHIDAKVSDIIDKYCQNWSNYGFETQTVKRKVHSFSNTDVTHACLWSSFVNIIMPKWLKMSELNSYYTYEYLSYSYIKSYSWYNPITKIKVKYKIRASSKHLFLINLVNLIKLTRCFATCNNIQGVLDHPYE